MISRNELSIHYLLYAYTMSGRIGKMAASHAECCRVDSGQKLHRFVLCTRRSGVTPMRVRGTTSQLDLPSLTHYP